MHLWILLILFFVLQCVFTPLFLKASWPNRTTKSHCLKMVCATLFVSTGLLSMTISSNFTSFARVMLVGLVLGWIGDLFLHFDNNKTFAIGFTSFLAGHVVYIKNYIDCLSKYQGYNHFNIIELVAFALLLVVAFVLFKKFKMEFSTNLLKIAVIAYTIILVLMFIKATSLGINHYLSGAEGGIGAVLTLFFGGLFFVASDGTIGILMFGGQKRNRPLKIFNIATYFAGQMLLALSILFVKA